MYSRAKLFGHPIHPMLVAFPVAFYTLTAVAYGVSLFVSTDPFWFRLGYFANLAGVTTAVLAAVPGFVDWAFGIPKESAAKSRGLLHLTLNVGALLLFAFSAFRLRGTWAGADAEVFPSFLLSTLGWVLTLAAGYHGWELIARHKVGVELTPEQERLEPETGRPPSHLAATMRPREV